MFSAAPTTWGMHRNITSWKACGNPWNMTDSCTYFSVSLPFIHDIVTWNDFRPQGCLRNLGTSATIFMWSFRMNIVPQVGSRMPSTMSSKARRNLQSLLSPFFASSKSIISLGFTLASLPNNSTQNYGMSSSSTLSFPLRLRLERSISEQSSPVLSQTPYAKF